METEIPNILPLFARAGIPVIRLGLNPTEELSGGAALGGAYHPALGELVYSRVRRNEAEALLRTLGGYTEDQIDRVKYLVGHHHTYTDVEGLDYRILIEADFLVNLYEAPDRYRAILTAEERIFRTASGKRLLQDIFSQK